MTFLDNLASKRQKFLDGIDANEGAINLGIFEDFYPDEAHFIYELLQNGEDAGAKEVSFELTALSCIFEHDGSRHFDEKDIDSITGIFNSSKKDNPDKIGKFGVGFKSVFVYTESPHIFSKNFNFRIVRLVLPQPISAKPALGARTRFELPFNNPRKKAQEAWAEIKSGLEQLSETTLLFLNNLHYIKWKVGSQEGAIYREAHSEVHIEVLKQVNGEEIQSSHWLRFSAPVEDIQRFTAPVDGVKRQRVAIAYRLEFIGDQKTFDGKKHLSKQLKIAPVTRGKVSVFFPAEKETSGLRYHLHAPFVPELSRASIKNSPENVPLFEQLAGVAARSLHNIKELGLLTGEFLAVLPNNDDPLPERYATIRQAVLTEMKTQPLVPTYAGGFAPARTLVQARATVKALLSDYDLALASGRSDDPTWAISATQRNSNQDRFLSSLGIPTWDAGDLKAFLENRIRETKKIFSDRKPDPVVEAWIKAKPVGWLQALYAVLYRYCEEDAKDYGELADTRIVRRIDGTLGTPRGAYFQMGEAGSGDPLPRVDENIFTAGTKKGQQEDAKKFLQKLGVRVPGEPEEITLLLKSRYSEEGEPPSEKVYLADLQRMIAFSEKNPQSSALFAKAFIFRVDAPEFDWGTAGDIFLDTPFVCTDLRILHESAKNQDTRRWPLSSWYLSCGIPLDTIVRFAVFVGCEREFNKLFVRTDCQKNPRANYLYRAPGERYGNCINLDFALTPEALALLEAKQVAAALLVWSALCRAEYTSPSALTACYQKNDRGGPHCADSQLVCLLRDIDWVPLIDGHFVTPRAATQAKLHRGFVVDAGFKWLERVEFGNEEKKKAIDTAGRAARRAEIGFETEEALQRALAFSRLPEDEQERVLSKAIQEPPKPVELPERPVHDAELRQKRVAEQARQTPEKETVIRPRSIALGYEAAKAEAKLYLVAQYTNGDGQMICQACKDELPFKLPNGAYYFEAVEVVSGGAKRFRETFLALCPNHAAAYQYANAQRNAMHDLVATASGSEIEVALGGVETTLYFTHMHLADAKACQESCNDERELV